MWFKNILPLRFAEKMAAQPEALAEQLTALKFQPCPATLPITAGWVSPYPQQDDSLVHAYQGKLLICLCIEEKLLPSSVVNEHLADKIQQIEQKQERKVRGREKLSLKESIYANLLPKAFSRRHKIHALIDCQKQLLLLNSIVDSKNQLFLSAIKKSLPQLTLTPINTKLIPPILSSWIKNQSQPKQFQLEKSCVLEDPNKPGRLIRTQQQEPTASSILALLRDNCEVTQLALNWNEQIQFTLKQDFTLRSIKYADALLKSAEEYFEESGDARFAADFIMMSETLSQLVSDLLSLFKKKQSEKQTEKHANLEAMA